jgi:hypothetical protein
MFTTVQMIVAVLVVRWLGIVAHICVSGDERAGRR